VQNSADQISITVDNANSPFTLAFRPDGSLTGSGTTQVTGRVVTGSNDTGMIYAPRTIRCAISSLSAN
jgi:hypothetical protein